MEENKVLELEEEIDQLTRKKDMVKIGKMLLCLLTNRVGIDKCKQKSISAARKIFTVFSKCRFCLKVNTITV